MFDRRPVETEKIQGQTTTQAAAESSCLSKQLPAMATRPETGQTFVLWLLDLEICFLSQRIIQLAQVQLAV